MPFQQIRVSDRQKATLKACARVRHRGNVSAYLLDLGLSGGVDGGRAARLTIAMADQARQIEQLVQRGGATRDELERLRARALEATR